MPEEPEENDGLTSAEPLKEYSCERCGFIYHKSFDYKPFLCYRCLRYMAKKVWIAANTIQPDVSVTKKEDI